MCGWWRQLWRRRVGNGFLGLLAPCRSQEDDYRCYDSDSDYQDDSARPPQARDGSAPNPPATATTTTLPPWPVHGLQAHRWP